MIRQLIATVSIALICLSIVPESQAQVDLTPIYARDVSDCTFPFVYRGKNYTDCTTDGDNGDIPWCALTTNYVGIFTYCFDFTNTSLKCLPTYQVNGKEYSGCNFLSKSSPYKQCKSNNPKFPTIYCPDVQPENPKKYPKRRIDCDPRYKAMTLDHTKCFSPNRFAIRITITAEEKQELLDIHNQYRASVSAEYMFALSWDDTLADMADAHGMMGGFDHELSGNRLTLVFAWTNGQNMVYSQEIRNSLASLIDMMLGSEQQNFVWGVGCVPDGTCNHFTLAVLSNITHVGCAHTQVIYPHGAERFLTCNFMLSQYASTYMTPYVPSKTPGSKCPKTVNSDGLCDCKGKYCRYDKGEWLHPNTCQCITDKPKRSVAEHQPVISAPFSDKSHLLSKRGLRALKKGNGFKKQKA